jgi:hypothetical protein
MILRPWLLDAMANNDAYIIRWEMMLLDDICTLVILA